MLTLFCQLPLDVLDTDGEPFDYVVRGCNTTDAYQMAALYFEAYDPGQACDSLNEAVADIKATFAGEYGHLLTAASLVAVSPGGEMCATALVVERAPWEDTPRCPFVIELFTGRDHRRRGLATTLLARSSCVLAAGGHEAMALRVVEENTAAVGLYRQLGFRYWDTTSLCM